MSSSQAARMMHMSNTKLNAAGLTPDHSLVLPERAAQNDELIILQVLSELYTSGSSQMSSLSVFADQVVFTLSNGDVVVGPKAVSEAFAAAAADAQQQACTRSVHQRLLQTPDSLPARTMCIDQVISSHGDDRTGNNTGASVRSVRNLIVLKRRASDGLIVGFTEEEGHRRPTAPLAARAASGNSFYSPTDNMLSPCTSKLNLAKKKHHFKGKPTTLFASALVANNKQQQSQ